MPSDDLKAKAEAGDKAAMNDLAVEYAEQGDRAAADHWYARSGAADQTRSSEPQQKSDHHGTRRLSWNTTLSN
jgi:hypothetical protein